jgi:uncharacterized small protein (DUF1192 family)
MNKAIALLKFEIVRLRGNLSAKRTGFEIDPDTDSTIAEYERAIATLTRKDNDNEQRPVRGN